MITRVAVGTDGSEPASRATAWGVALAKQLGAGVAMIHVFTVDPCDCRADTSRCPSSSGRRYADVINGTWKDRGLQRACN